MTTQDIHQKLLKIVKTYLPQDVDPSSITPEAHLMKNLNINSAHLVDIALDVEDAFDITLNEADMAAMETVENVVTIVQGKLG